MKLFKCKHNQVCRYTHGFYCEDCNQFFSKDSSVYRSTELLSDIWMVLWNINVDRHRKKLLEDKEVTLMIDKIGIGKKHKNYEAIIIQAEKIMTRYHVISDSASIELK